MYTIGCVKSLTEGHPIMAILISEMYLPGSPVSARSGADFSDLYALPGIALYGGMKCTRT